MPADVIVIGGGVIGSSIAYHLLDEGFPGRVIVVERDPTYARASSNLAMGGIRQQFSSALNIQLAQFSIAFYARFDRRFGLTGAAAVVFRQRGYLFLVDASNRDRFDARFERQRSLGARLSRLSTADMARRIPGLVLDDIEFGILGPDDGYANPKAVLHGFRHAAQSAGAEFVAAEVTALRRDGHRVHGVVVNGDEAIDGAVVVNAAGPYAARIATMADLDLPVRPVRQHLFRAYLQAHTPERHPMIVDPSGVHWRQEDPVAPGDPDRIIVACTKLDEPPGENFACDHSRWEREFLPPLRRRLPAHGDYSRVEGWSGLYEMTPDHNPVIGQHPDRPGLLFANGFSGHGLMMAPAAGKAVSELVRLGRCETFDLTPLRPTRFDDDQLFWDEAMI